MPLPKGQPVDVTVYRETYKKHKFVGIVTPVL
jgi:hypothetical protein